MTVIPFAQCDYLVLRSTGWQMPTGFLADETRAGTRKVRAANTSEPNSFSVTLRFPTLADYKTFDHWYNVTDRKGVFAFNFRNLKTMKSERAYSVYRFSSEAAPNASNPMGEVVDVSMQWEEV